MSYFERIPTELKCKIILMMDDDSAITLAASYPTLVLPIIRGSAALAQRMLLLHCGTEKEEIQINTAVGRLMACRGWRLDTTPSGKGAGPLFITITRDRSLPIAQKHSFGVPVDVLMQLGSLMSVASGMREIALTCTYALICGTEAMAPMQCLSAATSVTSLMDVASKVEEEEGWTSLEEADGTESAFELFDSLTI